MILGYCMFCRALSIVWVGEVELRDNVAHNCTSNKVRAAFGQTE